jgi:hypothetical protein
MLNTADNMQEATRDVVTSMLVGTDATQPGDKLPAVS